MSQRPFATWLAAVSWWTRVQIGGEGLGGLRRYRGGGVLGECGSTPRDSQPAASA